MKSLRIPKESTFIGPALLWKRIAAFFIDIAVINIVVLFPFRRLLQGMIPKDYSFSEAYKLLSSSTNYTGFITSLFFAISVLIIMYFILLERKMGQTIGKTIMKIYVVSDLKSLKAWQLMVRNLMFIPIFPFVVLLILDPLFMIFTKTNQRLSEILSKTSVVEKFSLGQ